MDLGLLQAEAARRAGVKVATYQIWERDVAVPTAPMMGKLVRFLGHDPTPLPANFPGRLTILRRRVGLTQVALAGLVGVDVSTVSSWETGATSPPPAYKARILHALGANAESSLSPP